MLQRQQSPILQDSPAATYSFSVRSLAVLQNSQISAQDSYNSKSDRSNSGKIDLQDEGTHVKVHLLRVSDGHRSYHVVIQSVLTKLDSRHRLSVDSAYHQ